MNEGNRRRPCWSGLLCAQTALLGFFLPFLSAWDRSYSLYQVYGEIGRAEAAWMLIAVMVLAEALALLGIRRGAALAGLVVLVWGALAVGTMLDAASPAQLFSHMGAGVWCHMAGAAGLAACLLLRRLDDRVFSALCRRWTATEDGKSRFLL